jgi:hypothetical protein
MSRMEAVGVLHTAGALGEYGSFRDFSPAAAKTIVRWLRKS